MSASLPTTPAYLQLLGDLKNRIQTARLSTARAVNRGLILLYWDIGKTITLQQQQQGWGKSVVETLARDLQKEFPNIRGFSADNLWRIQQFYTTYTAKEFFSQVGSKLLKDKDKSAILPLSQADTPLLEQAVPEFLATVPWGHHLVILKKIKTTAARLYYLKASAQLGWSRNVLLNQIKAKAYERTLAANKRHNFALALPEHLAEQAGEMLKSSYNLEFLGIGGLLKERELESKLISHLRDFILELGYGFCFVGQQYRLTLSQKEYFIDLLFYHRFLKALIAIELKVGAFQPEYAGKMDFYLNLLNDQERAPDDAPSIGIILCAEKDDVEVEYALKTKANPIGVAEYQLQASLPREFKGKLPTSRQLSEVIKAAVKSQES